jgi:hypothetical protein
MKRHCHYVFCSVDELKEPTETHKLPIAAYKSIGLKSNDFVFSLIQFWGIQAHKII